MMPLFSVKCKKCGKAYEIYDQEYHETKCEVCGHDCERIFGKINSRAQMDANDLYENKILPEAEKIMDNVSRGSDEDFFDICGEK